MKNILTHGLLVSCVLISVAASAGIKKYPVDGKHSTILMKIGEAAAVLDVELIQVSLSADELKTKGMNFTGETTAKISKVYKGNYRPGNQIKFLADNYSSEKWAAGLNTIVYLDGEGRAFSTVWKGSFAYEQFKIAFDPLAGKLKTLNESVFQAIRDARLRVEKSCVNPPNGMSLKDCKYYLSNW